MSQSASTTSATSRPSASVAAAPAIPSAATSPSDAANDKSNKKRKPSPTNAAVSPNKKQVVELNAEHVSNAAAAATSFTGDGVDMDLGSGGEDDDDDEGADHAAETDESKTAAGGTSSTSTPNQKRNSVGGRLLGAGNYGPEDTKVLLEEIERLMPTLPSHWHAVAAAYNLRQNQTREGDSLRKKFSSLCKNPRIAVLASMGGPPSIVHGDQVSLRAVQLQQKIRMNKGATSPSVAGGILSSSTTGGIAGSGSTAASVPLTAESFLQQLQQQQQQLPPSLPLISVSSTNPAIDPKSVLMSDSIAATRSPFSTAMPPSAATAAGVNGTASAAAASLPSASTFSTLLQSSVGNTSSSTSPSITVPTTAPFPTTSSLPPTSTASSAAAAALLSTPPSLDALCRSMNAIAEQIAPMMRAITYLIDKEQKRELQLAMARADPQ